MTHPRSPTFLVVSVESIRSMIDQAPPGLDSPMSGVLALMPIPLDSIYTLDHLLSDFAAFAWPIFLLHVEEGGSFRTLFRIGTFMPNIALVERSISGSLSIRIGMPSGLVPAGSTSDSAPFGTGSHFLSLPRGGLFSATSASCRSYDFRSLTAAFLLFGLT